MKNLFKFLLFSIAFLMLLVSPAMADVEATTFLDSLSTIGTQDLPVLIPVVVTVLETIIRLLPTNKNYSILKMIINILDKILLGIKTIESVIPTNNGKATS